MRKILIIAVGLVLVSAVAMSADIPQNRIMNAVYKAVGENTGNLMVDLSTDVIEVSKIDTGVVDVGKISSALPAGTNKIGSLSDTAVAIPGGVNATLTDTAFTGKLPADIKPFVFAFYDTSTAGTIIFTGVLKNIGITSAGAVTDSATIYINGAMYDVLLGGEDSGEGLEGYLLNPEIRWELNGVNRIRIKLSGYQN